MDWSAGLARFCKTAGTSPVNEVVIMRCFLIVAILLAGMWSPLPIQQVYAKSCIDHAYEHMDVVFVRVEEDGKEVTSPLKEIEQLNQLLNSAARGQWVLFWNKETSGFGKFYRLEKPLSPTPEQTAYIEGFTHAKLETSCDYEVDYTPILPGIYPFQEDHSTGKKTSEGSEVLTISEDRQTVRLDFSISGRKYTAVYRVTCAHFDWTSRGVCGPGATRP